MLAVQQSLSTLYWKKNNLSNSELVLIFRYIRDQRYGKPNLKQHWAAKAKELVMSAASLQNLPSEDRAIIKHWSEYGQRGATPLRRILPSNWPGITPFIDAACVADRSSIRLIHSLTRIPEGRIHRF